MALVVAQHAGTKAIIKNTFLEFTSASEETTGGPALRRTRSSPCLLSNLSKKVSWCDVAETDTDASWCEGPGRSEELDTDSCGSSDDFALRVKEPTERGSPMLLSDLLQIETWPCSAAKKVPDEGETSSVTDARTPLRKPVPEEASAPRRTPLSTKAVAYVPRALAAASEAPPVAANGGPWGCTHLTPCWPAPSAPAPSATWHAASVQKKAAHGEPCVQRTTVMLKNLPPLYTREMLIDLLESQGFLQHCDFLYLPVNFKRVQSIGYAFLNLTSPEQTKQFFDAFDGFNDWAVESDLVCSVCWSATQGLSENVERYRNSPIMREDVPDTFKPVLISGGSLLAFPKPTKELRSLRCRKAHGLPRHEESAGAEDCDF